MYDVPVDAGPDIILVGRKVDTTRGVPVILVNKGLDIVPIVRDIGVVRCVPVDAGPDIVLVSRKVDTVRGVPVVLVDIGPGIVLLDRRVDRGG